MAERNLAGEFYKYSTASETTQVTTVTGYIPKKGDIVKNVSGSAAPIDPLADPRSENLAWGVVTNATPVLIEGEFPSCTIAISAKAGIYIPQASFGTPYPAAGDMAYGIRVIDGADSDGNLIGSF